MIDVVLQTRGLHKSFGGLRVLEGIDFDLRRGERHALIGPNGSGKTTFVNMLTGILPASAGSIELFGSDVTRATPQERIAQGLVRSFQINELFPLLTPLQSVMAAICQRDGIHKLSVRPLASFRKQIDEAVDLLERYGMGEDRLQPTHVLPYGKQRLLEIILGVALNPRILILDEPAAGLSTQQGHALFHHLTQLPGDTSILFVEHDMHLVFRYADRISVFAGGHLLAQGNPEEIRQDPRVRAAYLGSSQETEKIRAGLTAGAARRATPAQFEAAAAPVLAIDKLVAGHGDAMVLQDVSFNLGPRESLVVIGRNGVGKTTLLETIMGLTVRRSGSITFQGRQVSALSPNQRNRAGIAWVPQEREVFASLTVLENLTVVQRPGPWTLERIYELFPRLRERQRHFANKMSGGEQQMLAIARALMTNPKLLLLDEPTEGLAPVIVAELLQAIDRMRRDGNMSIIMVEQKYDLALAAFERCIAIDRGAIAYDGPSAALLEDEARLARFVSVEN